MNPYGRVCGSFGVLISPNVSLCVFIGFYGSLLDLIVPYASLCVLMHPHAS